MTSSPGPLLLILGMACAALGGTPPPSPGPCRALVVWAEGAGAEDFTTHLTEALGPSAGVLVGRLVLRTSGGRGSSPTPSSGWRDAPQRLAEALIAHSATCLVVGPDRQLAHLALQMAVKTNVKVVMVGVTDPSALRLPIPGVRIVPAQVASSVAAATAVAGILCPYPGSPPWGRISQSLTARDKERALWH